MENAGTERAKGIQNRPCGSGKRSGNARKILNRGNEATDLLNTQDLAFSRSQKELFFECNKNRLKRETTAVTKFPPRAARDVRLFKSRSQKRRIRDSGQTRPRLTCGAARQGRMGEFAGMLKQRDSFKKCGNYAGILLKTKDRWGKPGAEAGMFLKRKEVGGRS
jgi:hypothetical protein